MFFFEYVGIVRITYYQHQQYIYVLKKQQENYSWGSTQYKLSLNIRASIVLSYKKRGRLTNIKAKLRVLNIYEADHNIKNMIFASQSY